jgi:hypothetical protein
LWTFGLKSRRVRRFENDTLLPKERFLPVTAQILAISTRLPEEHMTPDDRIILAQFQPSGVISTVLFSVIDMGAFGAAHLDDDAVTLLLRHEGPFRINTRLL